MSFTKLDYCQYLLSSPINYTVTNLANHLEGISHDRINRYLRGERLTPRLLWDNVKPLLQVSEDAYILFDDTVLDKRYSTSIEVARRQYSGNEHRVIRGIGLISCVYVNGETGQFWVIDYRLYDPDGDGQSKLDHVTAMLNGVVYSKQLPFTTVLMDSWYATQNLMAQVDQLEKRYYCPLKSNRRVDDTGGTVPYVRVDELSWSAQDLQQGKQIKIRGFPKDKKVNLFRVTVSTNRTEFIATNDDSQASTDAVQEVCGIRWKIEEFHRELKQLTGVEACQCRTARIQRNHIACALLVWSRLKTIAYQTGRTIYQIKHGMLSDYLIEQLKHPSVQMSLA
ncbi:Mobile element protein [uncultured Synechococcales cyanobacterium]|uniref:Mobile element protein n=1 Tax=uncultured Synechococcales cyanobacterium TaxID=1936017 RepID=A0A6J4VSN5_9CYAN|nr:Mobile element protein [uncultured Synechococcales cyanobacterium]